MQKNGMVAFGSMGVAALEGDGFLGINLASSIAGHNEKQKRKQPDSPEEESEQEAEEDLGDEAGKPAANGKPKPKPQKAWDSESKTLKAEKDYNRGVDTLRASLEATQTDMTQAMSEFRALINVEDH